jgi:hypothetical protein
VAADPGKRFADGRALFIAGVRQRLPPAKGAPAPPEAICAPPAVIQAPDESFRLKPIRGTVPERWLQQHVSDQMVLQGKGHSQ